MIKQMLVILFFFNFPYLSFASGDVCDGSVIDCGTDTGGGGDRYVLDFLTVAKAIRGMFSNSEVAVSFPEIDRDELFEAIASTKVTSKDQLFLNGIEVDAINYPNQKLIELNRQRWKPYLDDPFERLYAIVLHEYLGIMKVDDTDYALSIRFNQWILDQELPSKKGIVKYQIMKVSENSVGFKKEDIVCKGVFSFFPSFADSPSEVKCPSWFAGRPVRVKVSVEGLLNRGGGWTGWPANFRGNSIGYFSWLTVLGVQDNSVKGLDQNQTTYSTRPKGNNIVHLLRPKSSEVSKTCEKCTTGSGDIEYFYAFLEIAN